ncbi:lipopolysaccharide transport periplasmic protein LptA [Marinihelvus fidelis]|uniref:Lipopolysaccharide export system protein LptA n=1 Tax=Marinihelvus fidelis TaxID=2613842 RepID=A0A5N0TJD2_9GAMM|nr:lipopolysaccharide transport periplasmic protein LptA [Marinihelvus fidelis]KAA9133419.1 lipopolysaccharide transport periplasmic protein LptA [Marinihelvus fidelis]
MRSRRIDRWAAATLLLATLNAAALQTDRQQPLDVKADSGDGTFGDGVTVLSGNVEVNQGTLHITADRASVEKLDGKVRLVTLQGQPAVLEQEIEEQGLVRAEARTITYQVGDGLVNLNGEADVTHPQYHITGDALTYDLNKQHFQGVGGDTGDGRIRIRMDPEVADEAAASPATPDDGNDGH